MFNLYYIDTMYTYLDIIYTIYIYIYIYIYKNICVCMYVCTCVSILYNMGVTISKQITSVIKHTYD